MLAMTTRLQERIERYRKEHRHRVDRLCSSSQAEAVGSVVRGGSLVREPSLIELAERYPSKRH